MGGVHRTTVLVVGFSRVLSEPVSHQGIIVARDAVWHFNPAACGVFPCAKRPDSTSLTASSARAKPPRTRAASGLPASSFAPASWGCFPVGSVSFNCSIWWCRLLALEVSYILVSPCGSPHLFPFQMGKVTALLAAVLCVGGIVDGLCFPQRVFSAATPHNPSRPMIS